MDFSVVCFQIMSVLNIVEHIRMLFLDWIMVSDSKKYYESFVHMISMLLYFNHAQICLHYKPSNAFTQSSQVVAFIFVFSYSEWFRFFEIKTLSIVQLTVGVGTCVQYNALRCAYSHSCTRNKHQITRKWNQFFFLFILPI